MNKHRGEVEITLDGKAYVMRPTFEAMAEIEAKIGHGILWLATRASEGDIGITEVAVIIAAGLKAAGEPATADTVGPIVFRTGLVKVLVPVGEYLTSALMGGEPPGEAEAADS